MTNLQLMDLQAILPEDVTVLETVIGGTRKMIVSNDFTYLNKMEKAFLQEFGDVPIVYTPLSTGVSLPSSKISVLSKSLALMGLDYVDNERNE